jgi:hypothetical protein
VTSFTPAIALSGALGQHAAPDDTKRPATPAIAASAPGAPEAACGTSPLPDCPLQGWMKANAATALEAGDSVRLERALRRLATLAPTEYEDWVRLSLDAAEAAKRSDFSAVRRACRECHSNHRGHYRRVHRSDALQERVR